MAITRIIDSWRTRYLKKLRFLCKAKSLIAKDSIWVPTASLMYTMRGINAAIVRFLERIISKFFTMAEARIPPTRPSISHGRRWKTADLNDR